MSEKDQSTSRSSKHTPEPWVVHHTLNVVMSDGEVIAIPRGSGDLVNIEANARLIAAAPETAAERDRLKAVNRELLSALQGCRLELIVHGVYGMPLDDVDDAIAIAEEPAS